MRRPEIQSLIEDGGKERIAMLEQERDELQTEKQVQRLMEQMREKSYRMDVVSPASLLQVRFTLSAIQSHAN